MEMDMEKEKENENENENEQNLATNFRSFSCRHENSDTGETPHLPLPESGETDVGKSDDGEKEAAVNSHDEKEGKEEKERNEEKERRDGTEEKEEKDGKEEKAKEVEKEENVDVPEAHPLDLTLEKASEEIDHLVETLQKNVEVEGALLEIPDFIDRFLDLVEEIIVKYDTGDSKAKWGQNAEEDSNFLESVDRVSKLVKLLHEAQSSEEITQRKDTLMNRIGAIQQRAMSYLEDEFRLLMEESKNQTESDLGGHDQKGKQSEQDPAPESETPEPGPDFPGFLDDAVSKLNKIAKEMIAGGYKSECCQVYLISRRHAFEENLHKVGYEKFCIDEIQKMQWESLEREIPTWIKTFKDCAAMYFFGERKLAESIFTEHPSTAASLFSKLSRNIVFQLLNFAEGVAMTKRSAEKIFKFLDMYETLRDVIPAFDDLFPEDCANELKTETTTAKNRLGEAAICIFCDLENSIRSDTGKTPVPGGAVHPMTCYIMNYLRYACEYTETLEQVFKEHSRIERADSTSRPHYERDNGGGNKNQQNDEGKSPFSAQLMRVMDLLDSNLEMKAKLYKDVALSCIFKMNNGRYILQKIKGATEIYQMMGDTWCRKRSSELRSYHKNYQRETWSKILQCLNPEGLTVNGKVQKPVLKERFKNFNALFDEIHRTQSQWVVRDEQLQSELRVSISAVVIPAYRAFMGRFSQILDPGRQTEKYIKYQPEDIETYIDELFDGNTGSMGKKRT